VGVVAVSAFWAVIGDIVRSRAIADRGALQARLEGVLPRVNGDLDAAPVSAWTVTLGDEFQALFDTPAPLPAVLEQISHGLTGYAVRFGVGHGPLSTPLKPTAVGMDGPCFHRARAAVETARRERRRIVVATGTGIAQPVTDVWNLALTVTRARTARQAEMIEAYRAHGSQAAVAAHLGVTQGTVSAELARGRFAEVQAVLAQLPAMLETAGRGGGA